MSIWVHFRTCLVLLGAALLIGCDARAQQDFARSTAPPHVGDGAMQKATFGAGCFWGIEAAFNKIKGVTSTAVGYSGGDFDNPTYQNVCSGTTGHAEVVQVEYDPSVVSYEGLLDSFWNCHNPTQENRQGPDIGAQYRSVIFFHTPEQQSAAIAAKQRLEGSVGGGLRIATRIEPASTFWRAEDYHQKYVEKQGRASCAY
jgi:peptide-methionine (S)-S-oxide reductase